MCVALEVRALKNLLVAIFLVSLASLFLLVLFFPPSESTETMRSMTIQ